MRKMLKNEPDFFFEKMKAQNRRITFEKLKVRSITKYWVDKMNGTEPRIVFAEYDRDLFKEIRKTAKVVVKLSNESDLDFKLFKNKAVGNAFPKEYKGSFTDYVCGVGRKQISY